MKITITIQVEDAEQPADPQPEGATSQAELRWQPTYIGFAPQED